jgi:hypothetical protein
MVALIFLLLHLGGSAFKSKSRLEAENAALRQQLIVLQRKVRGRVRLTNSDRLFFTLLYRWFSSVLKAITIIRPETLVRWHRAGSIAMPSSWPSSWMAPTTHESRGPSSKTLPSNC